MSNCPISYNLRNSGTHLALPKRKTEFRKRGFAYIGAFLWNNLPAVVKNVRSLNYLKKN